MDNPITNTQKSLYERLGGEPGVRKIADDVLDKNLSNPLISYHFRDIDMDKLKQSVFEFFSMGPEDLINIQAGICVKHIPA